MIITRDEHYRFLEDELRAQTDQFKQKLDTKASYLREEMGELFLAQFLKFENGEMLLKMSNRYSVPRRGDYLYCFTILKQLRNPREWGDRTYGDLVKNKGFYSEVVCIWQSAIKEDPCFCLVGFRGVDSEFAEQLQGAEGMIVVLGPNKPPYEYIANLQRIVRRTDDEGISRILDYDFNFREENPVLLQDSGNAELLIHQLQLSDTLILQGPPGTGKTHLIAEICAKLCKEGHSVLVTALTNRALLEVAQKDALTDLLKEGHVFKTNLKVDEEEEVPLLMRTKSLMPCPGCLMLSTFYIASGEAAEACSQPFDYVIVDEASQALLAMFAAAMCLGKHNLWIGDTKQLPPVVVINENKASARNYAPLIDGLNTVSSGMCLPNYQLTNTYRLNAGAAEYTGLFYNGSLLSRSSLNDFSYLQLGETNRLLNPQGGPSILLTDLPIGEKSPRNALALATMLAARLLSLNEGKPKKERISVAILSFYVETTKALQKAVFQTIGNCSELLVETVSKVQGLTTDFTIYVIPNTGYERLLNRSLFNVATSRSTRQTILIADTKIASYRHLDPLVGTYLSRLCAEHATTIKPTPDPAPAIG